MNWDSLVRTPENQLPENNWALGYFLTPFRGWDGKCRTRNFHELRARDLALFALGDMSGKKVLEIGCGAGIYLDIMARMGIEVSGQDISSEAVKQAVDCLRQNNFNGEVKAGDAQNLFFEDNYFDAVFSADFFEHIDNDKKRKVIAEAYRVLKPGGILVIKTPNKDYLRWGVFLRRIKALLMLRTPFGIYIPHTRNNPDSQHCGLTTFKELESMLFNSMFHFPEIIYFPLERKRLPRILQRFLFGKKAFTDHIIIKTRKPLFYGFLG